jgi:hypothetical protein
MKTVVQHMKIAHDVHLCPHTCLLEGAIWRTVCRGVLDACTTRLAVSCSQWHWRFCAHAELATTCCGMPLHLVPPTFSTVLKARSTGAMHHPMYTANCSCLLPGVLLMSPAWSAAHVSCLRVCARVACTVVPAASRSCWISTVYTDASVSL